MELKGLDAQGLGVAQRVEQLRLVAGGQQNDRGVLGVGRLLEAQLQEGVTCLDGLLADWEVSASEGIGPGLFSAANLRHLSLLG